MLISAKSFLSVALFVVEEIISQSIKNKVATQATLYIISGTKVHAPLTGYPTRSYRRFDSL